MKKLKIVMACNYSLKGYEIISHPFGKEEIEYVHSSIENRRNDIFLSRTGFFLHNLGWTIAEIKRISTGCTVGQLKIFFKTMMNVCLD